MMKLKGWMLRKVNGMGNPASRAEPQSHAAMAAHGAGAPQTHMHEPRMRAVGQQRGGVPDDAEHLGPYSALIGAIREEDRKSTRLNSSHTVISYAVFCLKKKRIKNK